MKKNNTTFTRSHIIWGIVSILFAVFLYVGCSVEHTGGMIGLSTARIAPFTILLLSFLIFAGITWVRCISRASRLQPTMSMERWVFWLLLSVYLLYIFLLYPGSVQYDTHDQLRQFLGGYGMPLANHNPIAVTVFYGVLFKIGSRIADPNFGIFLGCFAQALLMAYAFSKVFAFVKQSSNSKWASFCTFFFFVLNPMWGGAAQILLKDSLHVSIFILFFLQFIKMFDEDCSRKELLLFIFWMFAAAVTRMATCYIILVCGLMLVLYHAKKQRRLFIVVTVAFWLVFSLYENVLIPGMGIKNAPVQENYVLQFQQVAHVCIEHGDELSDEDIAIIDSVLDFEAIKQVYKTDIADYIKRLYHPDGSLQEFNALYFRLLLRYPMSCLKALILNNWKYFYPPSVGYKYFRSYVPENVLGIYRVGGATPLVEKWADMWGERPILKLFVGPGLYTWLTIVAFAVALAKKNKKSILVVLPMIIFTLGMLATPRNGENRYAYPIMAAVPVLLACVCTTAEKTPADDKSY